MTRPLLASLSLRACAALALALPLAAQATLLARDLNADSVTDAWYDTTLDISWYANPNAFFGTHASVRTAVDGLSVGAASNWRLTHALPVNGSSYDFGFSNNGSTDLGYAAPGTGWGLASELGHLYYVTLGLQGYCTADSAAPGGCALNPGFSMPAAVADLGPFMGLNLLSSYLSNEQPSPGTAVAFDLRYGVQFVYNEGVPTGYGWAVHDGDVGNLVAGPGPGGGELPLPGTLLLATGALAGLGFTGRVRQRAGSGRSRALASPAHEHGTTA